MPHGDAVVDANGVEDELVSTGPNHFTFKGSRGAGIEIWFEKSKNGRKNMYYKLQNDPPNRFVEYTPVSVNSLELNQYTGAYYSPELQTIYAIEQMGDQLYAVHSKRVY